MAPSSPEPFVVPASPHPDTATMTETLAPAMPAVMERCHLEICMLSSRGEFPSRGVCCRFSPHPSPEMFFCDLVTPALELVLPNATTYARAPWFVANLDARIAPLTDWWF